MLDRQQSLDSLRQCPLFKDVQPKALDTIVDYMDIMEGSPGDRLYNEGETAHAPYVVARGSCVAIVTDANQQERVVRTYNSPDSFGELSLLLRSERLVGIEASTDVVLLELTTESFRSLKRRNPEAALLIIMSIVRRFGRVMDETRGVLKRALLRYFEGMDGG